MPSSGRRFADHAVQPYAEFATPERAPGQKFADPIVQPYVVSADTQRLIDDYVAAVKARPILLYSDAGSIPPCTNKLGV